MKRIVAAIILIIIAAPVLVFAEQASVVTKENAVREYCRFFAPVVAPVRYKDVLDIVCPQDDWYKVRYKATEGCIHRTAVEKRSASFTGSTLPGRGAGSVSESEAALAGKGFNPQVEASYRKKYPAMKYNLVDRIEHENVSEKEIVSFITGGGLNQP
ncbi:MAG TPA: hypothetical protein PLX02_07740 [Syntrophorhabdaceae bacterium]|nr:hypothetical protein [Syntrophorhabdaceae bacterium]HQM81495.1 hypothetical protein [Syntrophorhabdaceae bacterium]